MLNHRKNLDYLFDNTSDDVQEGACIFKAIRTRSKTICHWQYSESSTAIG